MGFDYQKVRSDAQALSLNELLDQLENNVSDIGQGGSDNAQELLVGLDEAQHRIDQMIQKQVPVKAEKAQFDYVVATLEKNAGGMLKDLGGSRQLEALRRQLSDQPESRWWFLDRFYLAQRRKNITRKIIAAGSAVLVIALLIIVYTVFLKPDPSVAAKYAHQMNASQYLSEGNFSRAMEEINLASGYAPSDPGLLVMGGVIQVKMGNTTSADQDFNTAESILGNRVEFLLLRSQAWITAGDYQNTIADSQEIIREDPSSAEGYYYLGKANELLQHNQEAISAYETASHLADAQQKVELNATIRVSLAMLMQSGGGMISPGQ